MIFSDFCLSWTDDLTLIHAVIPQIIAHPELAGVRNSGAAFSNGFFFFFLIPSEAFPFQLDHHLILLLVVQLYMSLILKLSNGKGVLSTQDRYLNLYEYQTSAAGNSFKDFLLLSVDINC